MMQSIRFVVLMWIIYTLASVTTAQETVENVELVIPSGADYLALLNDVLADETADWWTPVPIVRDIVAFQRFDDGTVSAKDIVNVYKAIDQQIILESGWHFYLVTRALELWMTDNAIDLSEHNHLILDDFSFDITPIDFMNDGQPEYILHFTIPTDDPNRGILYHFGMYLLAYEQDGELRFAETPLPPYSEDIGFWLFTWKQLYLDINNDGAMEWVMLGHTPFASDLWDAIFYILTWDGSQWFDYTYGSLNISYKKREGMSWELSDTNHDHVLEFIKTTPHHNNWDCTYKTIDYYVLSSRSHIYELVNAAQVVPDSAGCLWQSAEEAMWSNNFDMAIPLYEQSFALFDKDPIDEDMELYQYLRARYVLALILNGDDVRAEVEFEKLIAQDAVTVAIQDLWDVMAQSYVPSENPYNLCVNLYRHFDVEEDQWTDIAQGFIGKTWENSDLAVVDFHFNVDPLKASCDVEWMIKFQTNYNHLPLDQSPLQVFMDTDIPIFQFSHFDWNYDGYDEWILQVDESEPFYVFISDVAQNTYQVDRYWYKIPDVSATHYLVLPDGSKIFAYYMLSTDRQIPSCFDLPTYEVNFLYWGDTSLRTAKSVLVCDIPIWDNIISEQGEKIAGWQYDYNQSTYIENRYIWQTDTGRYLVEEDLQPDTSPAPKSSYAKRTDLQKALIAGDDLTILIADLEQDLALEYSEVGHYLIALAYLQIDQPEQAVQHFTLVRNLSPETGEGRMAALYVPKPEARG